MAENSAQNLDEAENLHYNPATKNGVFIDGMMFPPKQPSGVDWTEHISDIKNLELRPSDVFICAYPKAGTHWVWEVAHMLLTGKVEYEKRTKENLMIEFLTKVTIDDLHSPRILNTHLPFSMLPVKEIKNKMVKVLHVYRNPKDVVVSMYFHFIQVFPYLKDFTLHEFLLMFLQDDMVYGNYFCYMRQAEKFIQENPDLPVFQISYEEMRKGDQIEHVRKIAKFLGVDASEELCHQIAEACSLEKMRSVDAEKFLPDISPHTMDKETRLYRKGQVGDWKNYLTVTMNQIMDKVIEDKMAGSSYKLQYT